MSASVTILDAAEAQFSRAETLRLLGRHAEAAAAYDRALALRPDHVASWSRRGVVLHEMGEFEDAVESFDRALALSPGSAEIHNNRSASLRVLGRCEEALAAADRALACDPDYARAYNSRGNALRSLGRIGDALWNYERAIAAFPGYGMLRFNRALCLLLAGDFAEGWRDYEWRWTIPDMKRHRRPFARRPWLGEGPLAGRTILLHAEQGIGDVLQFCRFATEVAARGARVVLGVPPALAPLMASLPGPELVVDQMERLPGFDLHCPLMSLPLALGTRLATIPRAVPYLATPAGRAKLWHDRLTVRDAGRAEGLRVGLAWSGNPGHADDRNRSLALETLAPVLSVPGARFFCLQRTLRPRDVPEFALHPDLAFFGPLLTDFADTAALVAQMDLVISADTAVLHLAGAMGRPAWALLPYAPDWRWMLERADSPWYPGMRLFRQEAPGDWDGVVRRIRTALMALCGRQEAGIF